MRYHPSGPVCFGPTWLMQFSSKVYYKVASPRERNELNLSSTRRQTAHGKSLSDAPRTMRPVAYTGPVGQWRIHDKYKRRECKNGGARLTILSDFGNVNRLIISFIYAAITRWWIKIYIVVSRMYLYVAVSYLTISAGHADVNAAAVLEDIFRLTLGHATRHRIVGQIFEISLAALAPRWRHVGYLHESRTISPAALLQPAAATATAAKTVWNIPLINNIATVLRLFFRDNPGEPVSERPCLDFCRAMLCISAAIAVMRCPSVCPSVTFVDHVKTNKHIFEIFHHLVATPF